MRVRDPSVYFFLATETIQKESGNWFGTRSSPEVAWREVKMLLAYYCRGVKSVVSDISKPATGLTLTFADKEQCLTFFNQFMSQDLAVWIEPEQVKDALRLIKDKPHKLYMFEDYSDTSSAIIAFENTKHLLAFKLSLP